MSKSSKSKEAQVTCLCQEFSVPEFKWDLKKGDVKWIDQHKVKTSESLQHAISIKAVSVQYVDRAGSVREPAPPYVRKLQPYKPAPILESMDKSLDKQFEDLKVFIGNEVQKAFRGILDEIKAGDVDLYNRLTEFWKTTSVPTVWTNTQNPTTQITTTGKPSDEPVWIPDNMVGSDAGSVNVRSSETENSSIGDASDALRKARKKDK